jgi:hypothetical protein
MKDRLFLLHTSFPDAAAGPGMFFCPACMQVEGMLASFPQLRDALDITYVDFPRPRRALVGLVGEAYQGCPVLVVANAGGVDCAALEPANGYLVAKDVPAIAAYFAARFGLPLPHP